MIQAHGQKVYWSTSKCLYDVESVVRIDDKRDLYAVISEKALKKIGDPRMCEQFTAALSKGCAKTGVGTNGIKFLDNDIVELKINGGGRIFASIIIENNTGKHLIVFNRYVAEHSSAHGIHCKFVKSEIVSVEHVSSEDDAMLTASMPVSQAVFDGVDLSGAHEESSEHM